MRRQYIAGNWKMNNTVAESEALARAVAAGVGAGAKADVAVIPPFLSVPAVVAALRGTAVKVGAQDVYFEKQGAFTGEISAGMLADAGCAFALVGHSERRHVIGETDAIVRRKLDALLAAGLEAILCVGEKLDEREAGKTEDRLKVQIRAGLGGLDGALLRRVTVAYEPVWAIGTGKTATTAQAEDAHRFIRSLVAELAGKEAAEALRIQYGGSVKPDNAAELLAQPDVDGALVGGAALKAEPFLGIVAGAR
ncbi:MAG: triose-phosphate isomerase [Proteobacteria bacterium]|jgi:triosephosphate isomerase|nr:triose-phosphate isomerase [Pseudomonadota bacterium]